jgi:TIR domain-containing protein
MDGQARQALFISHANPEDNAFTLWVGAKLTALGYPVFADILRLRGGDDWERILEDAIRNRAAKFLLVATPHGVQKQGVRNEITIATETAKRIDDKTFIIPLRLAAFDAPLLIAHAQYIDFSKGWAQGLNELLTLLSEIEELKTRTNANADTWRSVQLKDARSISSAPERLVSNWLPIESLPKRLAFYDFKGGISLGKAQKAIQEAPIPLVPFNRGFACFAPIHQLQDWFGPDLPLERIADTSIDDFLDDGWPDQHILARDARAKFTDLVRRAMDIFFQTKSLHSFELASERLAWWPTASRASLKKHSFNWPNGGPSGLRQIVGRSTKRGFFWHYGVSCWARTAPVRHVRVAGRVVFTSDGANPLGDARRLHRLRRSFCKSWRNPKWRDLLLAFWHWLAEGASTIDIPMGEDTVMRLHLPPLTLTAPFSVDAPDDRFEPMDDDDEEEGPDGGDDEGSEDDPEDLDNNP